MMCRSEELKMKLNLAILAISLLLGCGDNTAEDRDTAVVLDNVWYESVVDSIEGHAYITTRMWSGHGLTMIHAEHCKCKETPHD